MMKRFLVFFVLCIDILILFGCTNRKFIPESDMEIIVNYPAQRCFQCDNDNYYILQSDGIYLLHDEQLQNVIPLKNADMLAGSNSYIAVVLNGSIRIYSDTYEYIGEIKEKWKITELIIADDIMFFECYNNIDNNDPPWKIMIIELKTMENISLEDLSPARQKGDYSIYEYGEYSVINNESSDYPDISVCKNDLTVFGSKIIYGDDIYKIDNGNSDEYLLIGTENQVSIPVPFIADTPVFRAKDGNKVILTGVSSGVGPTLYPDKLFFHHSDQLAYYDFGTQSSNCYKTKSQERILYADASKAMTFYDGEYITYSADSFEKLSSAPADEIKRSGSYTFEPCGDYVFIFDNGTNDVINKLPIN